MNKKAFTLIELLVVVLIIAILAAIALPKYQVARDRAHLSGVMTVGKNVNDAQDRRSLFDSAEDGSSLEKLDITFKDYQGNECTGGGCRITISNTDYFLNPTLNAGDVQGKNYLSMYPYTNTAFGRLLMATDTYATGYNYRMYCYQSGSYVVPNEDRCVRLGLSMGASNAQCDTDNASPYCQWD